MTRRNAPFEVEQVKQLALIARLPTHHGKPPPPNLSRRRNHCSPKITSPFSTVSTLLCRTGCMTVCPLSGALRSRPDRATKLGLSETRIRRYAYSPPRATRLASVHAHKTGPY